MQNPRRKRSQPSDQSYVTLTGLTHSTLRQTARHSTAPDPQHSLYPLTLSLTQLHNGSSPPPSSQANSKGQSSVFSAQFSVLPYLISSHPFKSPPLPQAAPRRARNCACDDETHTTFAVFTRAPHRTYFGADEGQSSLDV